MKLKKYAKMRKTARAIIGLMVFQSCVFAADQLSAHWQYEYDELNLLLDTLDAYGHLVTDDSMYPHQLDRRSLFFATDKDAVDVVLRRTEALLAHLKTMDGTPDLSSEQTRMNA